MPTPSLREMHRQNLNASDGKHNCNLCCSKNSSNSTHILVTSNISTKKASLLSWHGAVPSDMASAMLSLV